MMRQELSPAIEAAALNQTEDAFRELVQVGINIGLTRPQLGMMLQRMANELLPKIVLPEPAQLQ